MCLAVRPFPLLGALVLGLPMAAQSVGDLLNRVPPSALNIEVYPRPRALDRKGLALGKRFEATGSWVGLKARTGLDVARLTGPLVMGVLPGPDKEKVEVVLAPVKTPLAALAQLKARVTGKVWTFTVPRAKKGEILPPRTWFAAPQGSILVLASDRQALEEVLSGRSSVDSEWAPLASTLPLHDSTLLVTERGTAKLLEGFSESLKKGVASEPPVPGMDVANLAMARAMSEGLESWVVKARASVNHFVLTLDVSEEGAIQVQGKAIFKKGSPLQKEFAALPTMGFHPLGTLPAGGFAFASGGQWPASFGSFAQWLIKSMDVPGNPLTPELREKWAKASEAVSKPLKSFHYSFSAPTKAGDALLSQLLVLMQVEDAATYRDASLEAANVQAEWMKVLGQGMTVSAQKDVLPGIPSWTTSLDFAGLAGGKMPPAQSKMFTSLLFGGDVMRFSYGEATPGIVVGVSGGAPELEKAIQRVKAGPALAAAPAITLTDRMLPKNCRFAFYLSPKGIRDLAQVLANSFMGPAAPSLPNLPDGEPAAISVTLDGNEAGFQVAVPAGTLHGGAALVKALKQLAPGKKGPAPKAPAKASK